MTELSMVELSVQSAELLPAREALDSTNKADIWAANVALAFPDYYGDAKAEAHQTIVLLQSNKD